MADSKRQRESPTGKTPVMKAKRRFQSAKVCTSRRKLSFVADCEKAETQKSSGIIASTEATCSASAGSSRLSTFPASVNVWSNIELLNLVQFVILNKRTDKWPASSKKKDFWNSAAKFVCEKSGCPLRAGV